ILVRHLETERACVEVARCVGVSDFEDEVGALAGLDHRQCSCAVALSVEHTPHLVASHSILRAVSLADSGALRGRVAIITRGASSLLSARGGARVAFVDVGEPELARPEADVRAAGGEAMALAADLAHPDDCEAVVARAIRGFGRLDVLLNNAGVGTMVVSGTV